jgi:hypothetical protein
MLTNSKIYNYFTSNQTQNHKVIEDQLYDIEIKKKIADVNVDFIKKMGKLASKYNSIEIKIDNEVENITHLYKERFQSILDRLEKSGVGESQILKIMTFITQELEMISPLINKGLPDTHSSRVSSLEPNLEIIIENRSSLPTEVKVRISNITSKIFDTPPEALAEAYDYREELYMFNGQITYNPETDTATSINTLISGDKPSVISRLMAKALSFLAVIFRVKNTP